MRKTQPPAIPVTGAAGFIGFHIALILLQACPWASEPPMKARRSLGLNVMMERGASAPWAAIVATGISLRSDAA